MKKIISILVFVFLLLAFTSLFARAEDLPSAPTPHVVNDGWGYHRGEDYAFGLVIAAPVGMATKPWIGLLAGEAAGVANEARYGRHFNVGHLVVISAGALTGYGLAKWEKHIDHVNAKKSEGL